jgi:Cupin-like domain
MSIAPIPERGPVDPDCFSREIADAFQPVVLRGQVADWPAVVAGRSGAEGIAAYIAGFDKGLAAEVMIGAPPINGRFFYKPDMRGFNFIREQVRLRDLVAELLRLQGESDPPALYAGAAAAAEHLPGWLEANPLPLPTPNAIPRIWIGNATRVSTHYDVASNVACVVAGRRRFTLFPPDQIANLYVGPLEWTIAGQPTSMVDPDAPDLERFPRFADAQAYAMTAELGPGDVIFIPSLWWHSITALDPLNVLLNYWWGQCDATPPFAALAHALLCVRDLPRAERDAWRVWFDHYVFGDDAQQAGDHIPVHARGVLGPPSAPRTAAVKDYLARTLERE